MPITENRVLEQFRIIEEQEDFIKAFEEIENSIEGYLNRTSISKTLETEYKKVPNKVIDTIFKN